MFCGHTWQRSDLLLKASVTATNQNYVVTLVIAVIKCQLEFEQHKDFAVIGGLICLIVAVYNSCMYIRAVDWFICSSEAKVSEMYLKVTLDAEM